VTPSAPTSDTQRWEIQSPEVVLLGILHDGKLTLYADHYASNEPILDAKIELENNGRVIPAKAEPDGSYSAPGDWLQQPGKYDLIASVEAPEFQDLIVGRIEIVASTPTAQAHSVWRYGKWLGGVAALVLALFVLLQVLRRRKRTALLVAPLLLGMLLGAQSDPGYAHGGEDHGAPPASNAAPVATGDKAVRQADGSLFVPKPVQRLLGIRTVLGQSSALAKTVELDGRVIADPNFSGRVQSSQAGRLAAPNGGFPTLGMRVRKGQVLAFIEPSASNIDKGNQQALLAELNSKLTLAENRAQRLAQLVGSLPQKEIDAAQAEAQSLKARQAAVAASLYQREALLAPVAGVISQANGVAGQVVEAREVLFEIVDPAHLRVEAIAYDSALSGQVASAVGVTSDKQNLALRFIGQSHQLREQALPLQFEIQTPLPALNVGQTLKVLVRARQTIDGIAVPRDSVLKNNQGEPMLWEQVNAERFVPQRVTVQALDANTMAVLQGLSDGARVVTQGAAALSQIK
jgi:RND family efflux transporter MFP subunit